ncbi:hypothetical protein [Streptomyces sp. NPDC006274]|uniref:hypothetical protein n=1 Tax=unclassified Streptomyces TaxID=2593676 RepID=UPI0033B52899
MVLLTGALVLVPGELYQASASWGLAFGLAPADRQGETCFDTIEDDVDAFAVAVAEELAAA